MFQVYSYFEKYVKPRKDLLIDDDFLDSDPPFPRESQHLSALLAPTDPDVVEASFRHFRYLFEENGWKVIPTVMSDLIQKDPTCFPILVAAGLPSAFVDAIMDDASNGFCNYYITEKVCIADVGMGYAAHEVEALDAPGVVITAMVNIFNVHGTFKELLATFEATSQLLWTLPYALPSSDIDVGKKGKEIHAPSTLKGISGPQRFQIHKASGAPDRLPSAHTCSNQLDLPEYTSKEQLQERLLLAVHEASEGFCLGDQYFAEIILQRSHHAC
ncbi:unnamed protein product [Sphenostylis stenocarpa]|uniref:HECT-type E3 ubiquitin transferase n=1 Tax=Sphenostylis stenocarpa TaxID=92480 RepID=A0AA86V613_9FABA|nr:unnamed protein product [Sphenostylis stenocarpa]